MIIQRLNIFFLSLAVALSPAVSFANPAVGYGVSALLPMQGAVEAMMADLAAQSTAAAVASMEVGTSAAALGATAAGLAAAGAVGYGAYGLTSAANEKYCISDYVSAALFNAGMSCGGGAITRPLDPNADHTVNPPYKEFGWMDNYNSPRKFFSNPLDACNSVVSSWGQHATSVSLRGDGGYQCEGISGTASVQYGRNTYYDPNAVPPTGSPPTNEDIGNALAASPPAVAETAASHAMAAAAAAGPDIGDCSRLGGTFNLNSNTCQPARNPTTGQPLTGVESAEHAAAMAALANSTANSKTQTDKAVAASQAFEAALADAVAHPEDQAKQDKLTAAQKDLTNSNANATTANTAATADAAKATATAGATQFPVFCTWAIVVCDAVSTVKEAIKWTKADETDPDTNLDFPDNPTPTNTQISFNSNCPAPITLLNSSFHGQPINWQIDFSALCNVFSTFVKPVVIAMGGFGAVMIIAGARENG